MPTAMVLCAGLGTRLAPLTSELPKPLMPIGDRPIIAHILAALGAGGIDQPVVNSHHLSRTLTACLARLAPRAAVVHEAEILGTAGGVRHAHQALGDGPVIIWNGDIWAPNLSVVELWAAFAQSGASWLWVIEPRPLSEGPLGIDEQGAVVRLRGERFGREVQGGEFIGVSVLAAGLRDRLPLRGCLVGDLALPWLRAGGRIDSWMRGHGFFDVGTHAALLAANQCWLEQRGLSSWRASDARCAEGVELEGAVIGSGAQVLGIGQVSATVVFPGAQLIAPAHRVLAAPFAQVDVAPAGAPAAHATTGK